MGPGRGRCAPLGAVLVIPEEIAQGQHTDTRYCQVPLVSISRMDPHPVGPDWPEMRGPEAGWQRAEPAGGTGGREGHRCGAAGVRGAREGHTCCGEARQSGGRWGGAPRCLLSWGPHRRPVLRSRRRQLGFLGGQGGSGAPRAPFLRPHLLLIARWSTSTRWSTRPSTSSLARGESWGASRGEPACPQRAAEAHAASWSLRTDSLAGGRSSSPRRGKMGPQGTPAPGPPGRRTVR